MFPNEFSVEYKLCVKDWIHPREILDFCIGIFYILKDHRLYLNYQPNIRSYYMLRDALSQARCQLTLLTSVGLFSGLL